MKMYDNSGNVVAEQTVAISKEGTIISTNTMYHNGNVVAQNIGVRDDSGSVRSESVLGGKLLP
jgi:hypothetical protein